MGMTERWCGAAVMAAQVEKMVGATPGLLREGKRSRTAQTRHDSPWSHTWPEQRSCCGPHLGNGQRLLKEGVPEGRAVFPCCLKSVFS